MGCPRVFTTKVGGTRGLGSRGSDAFGVPGLVSFLVSNPWGLHLTSPHARLPELSRGFTGVCESLDILCFDLS